MAARPARTARLRLRAYPPRQATAFLDRSVSLMETTTTEGKNQRARAAAGLRKLCSPRRDTEVRLRAVRLQPRARARRRAPKPELASAASRGGACWQRRAPPPGPSKPGERQRNGLVLTCVGAQQRAQQPRGRAPVLGGPVQAAARNTPPAAAWRACERRLTPACRARGPHTSFSTETLDHGGCCLASKRCVASRSSGRAPRA